MKFLKAKLYIFKIFTYVLCVAHFKGGKFTTAAVFIIRLDFMVVMYIHCTGGVSWLNKRGVMVIQ